jgi:dipeptidyl aminopeptidase/acylaminoacyl peptidase
MIQNSTLLIVLLGAGIALAGGCTSPAPMTERGIPPLAVLTSAGIYVVHGDVKRLVPGSEITDTMAWDKGGAALLITDGTRLLELAAASHAPRVLSEGWTKIRFPAISPDGRRIAFSGQLEGGWKIFICERDGSDLFELTKGYGPSWSHDGATIFFEGEGTGLYHIPSWGGEPVRFLPEMERAHTIRTSPDGKYIAFSHKGALYRYDVRKRVTGKLTSGAHYDRFASFSADGRWIAFYRQEGGQSVTHDRIVVLDLRTGAERIVWEEDGILGLFHPGS